MRTRGKLIVFEGPDGIGKSQLASDTCERLNERGVTSEKLSFPGITPNTLGQLVYDVHHAHNEKFAISSINPLSMQILHVAAHIDEIDRRIRPAIHRGTWIILDRYWWSTWVYGMIAGANQACLELVIRAEQTYWEDIIPAVIFLVRRDEPFRMEHTATTFSNLSSLYDTISERERGNTKVVEIENRELDASRKAILSILNELDGTGSGNILV